MREDAIEIEPLASLYHDDPRFKVAYDQLAVPSDNPATDGPVVGPLKEIRADNANATAAILNGSDVAERTGHGGRPRQHPHPRLQRRTPIARSPTGTETSRIVDGGGIGSRRPPNAGGVGEVDGG